MRNSTMKFKVTKGLGQGRRLGFPTINLRRPKQFRLRQGVYACFARIGRKTYPAAFYYGPKYNFGILRPSLEVHLISGGDIGRTKYIEIDVVKRVRNVGKFALVSSLKKQITRDIAEIKKIIKTC